MNAPHVAVLARRVTVPGESIGKHFVRVGVGSRSMVECVHVVIAWINVQIKPMFAHWQKRSVWNGNEVRGLPTGEGVF